MDFADQRRAYRKGALSDEAMALDPLKMLVDWLHEARESGEPEGTAMALATIDPDGGPSVRYVLCKGVTDRGIRFFTNLDSRKGIALAHEARAAATFWWAGSERAARVRGTTVALPREEVDAYFASRPRGSRIGAWASDQSRPIESREALEAQAARIEAGFSDEEPTDAPERWGGWELVAEEIELWQGRDDRLHDRLHFTRTETDWTAERLQP
ncbi:MAG: pyridoxamine 5'-phosphate oxidase [Solirubrobacteraceae bacterium]|nr:pyridoxamine 5'-phosphate oxidase [Solirubrobacteraceae bacterium]